MPINYATSIPDTKPLYASVTLGDRIRALRRELAALEQQQRDDLVHVILLRIGPGVVFSAAELWERQVLSVDLRTAFTEAGIRSPRQLGKRLRQLCGQRAVCDHLVVNHGLARVGVEHNRALWVVTAE